MPTENRSSNTEMVSVPVSWLQQMANNPHKRVEAYLPNIVHYISNRPWSAFYSSEQHQGEPVAWSRAKPATPGAYWVRGNGLEQDALIQVIDDQGELRCNLHQSTTETDFGYGYAVSDLSEEFEWLGPLYTHADPGEITIDQVLRAYEYAESHPHKYLRGTTNWCAAVAWHLNKNRSAQSGE